MVRPQVGLRTTFRVPAVAAWFVVVHDVEALADVFGSPQAAHEVLVLGEGSNILFTRDFDGLVVRPVLRGIDETGDGHVRVAAGENWHRFVRWSLEHGYAGLENLALIPGSVGAAPIQNIGAYGAELDEFVHRVHAWDRVAGGTVVLDNAACGFAYRDSRFRRAPDRYVITSVEFVLPRARRPNLSYAGVREELALTGVGEPTPTEVADAVERLRRRKLPDPGEIANAGSFFKNPVAPPAAARALLAAHPALPNWRTADGDIKLSAAWLVEQCGFKGYRQGDAGFSDRHALVLVNHGAASGAELWALAQRAQAAVEKKFGVVLEPEPRIV